MLQFDLRKHDVGMAIRPQDSLPPVGKLRVFEVLLFSEIDTLSVDSHLVAIPKR